VNFLQLQHDLLVFIEETLLSSKLPLAYGGAVAARKVSLEALTELAAESDARSLRQFLATTFGGVGTEAADKILNEAKLAPSSISLEA
jgi:hypothetical protein